LATPLYLTTATEDHSHHSCMHAHHCTVNRAVTQGWAVGESLVLQGATASVTGTSVATDPATSVGLVMACSRDYARRLQPLSAGLVTAAFVTDSSTAATAVNGRFDLIVTSLGSYTPALAAAASVNSSSSSGASETAGAAVLVHLFDGTGSSVTHPPFPLTVSSPLPPVTLSANTVVSPHSDSTNSSSTSNLALAAASSGTVSCSYWNTTTNSWQQNGLTFQRLAPCTTDSGSTGTAMCATCSTLHLTAFATRSQLPERVRPTWNTVSLTRDANLLEAYASSRTVVLAMLSIVILFFGLHAIVFYCKGHSKRRTQAHQARALYIEYGRIRKLPLPVDTMISQNGDSALRAANAAAALSSTYAATDRAALQQALSSKTVSSGISKRTAAVSDTAMLQMSQWHDDDIDMFVESSVVPRKVAQQQQKPPTPTVPLKLLSGTAHLEQQQQQQHNGERKSGMLMTALHAVVFNHNWQKLYASSGSRWGMSMTRSQFALVQLCDVMCNMCVQAIFYGRNQFSLDQKVRCTSWYQ
jgi:hypothetical protein